MAFNFPDPAVETTVTNPVTGATYQWKADPGKWVLAGGSPPEQSNTVNTEFLMQLRGNFEFDSDDKAIIPADSYNIADEDSPVIDPDTGFMIGDWQKPGVWWQGSALYEPNAITHLLVSLSRYVGVLDPITGGGGVDAGVFEQEWKAGDLIEVKAHEVIRITLDYYGKPIIQNIDGFTSNIWRVTEEVDLVNPAGDWPTTEYKCFAVEKVAPDYFYNGSFDVDQTSDTVETFFPCEVTNNPAAMLEDAVMKKGDTMTGNLAMDDANILIEDGSLIFNRSGTDIELQDEENRFSTIRSVAPYDIDTGTLDYSTKFGIKVDLDGGNSFKNNFKVGNRHGDIVRITSGEGAQIEFATSGFTPNAKNTGLTSGIAIRHIPTPSFEDSPGDLAVNKEYVDARDEILQQEIIELEEEIDAIAPATERGSWSYNPVGNVAAPGAYTMYTDTRDDGLGGVASIFAAVKNIALNERDLNNTVHSFGGTEPGDLIEIFEEGDADYGLYSIISIEKLSNPNPGGISYTYISIDVDLERTGNGDKAETRARFKVFKAPSGGDASGFVLKSGDTMTGDLFIDRSAESDVAAGLQLKGNRQTLSSSAASIKFENQTSAYIGYLTYRSYAGEAWFGFNQDVDLGNKGLHSVNRIRMQSGAYIGVGTNQRIVVRDGGANDGQTGTQIQRPGDGKRTFSIRGKAVNSSSVGDFFWAYGNNGSGGDAINYTGLTTAGTHIATKNYVDSKVGGIDIDCSTSGRSKGEMWYCPTDQVLYIKVS